MLSVFPIKAFRDNYIWCIQDSNTRDCIIIDPGDDKPVIKYLASNKLTLKAILVTHHHYDHVDGISELLAYAKRHSSDIIDVYGPSESKVKSITHPMKQGDQLTLLATTFEVNEVPGHTLDHISYYSDHDSQHSSPWLFCGDTLFSAGCGRLFEGTPAQMLGSLKKLTELPLNTEVYCTHEYTLSNLAFAQAVLPNDAKIKHYINTCQTKRDLSQPTLPSTIETELKINPFVLCGRTDVQNSVSQHTESLVVNELDTFTRLRSWKDSF